MKKSILILIFLICFLLGITSVSAKEKIIKTETEDKVMYITDEDGKFKYSWTFKKEDYENDDINMKINFISPYEKEINNLIINNIKKEYLSFAYHGTLPSTATIKVPITKFKDGDKLNLYYYNDETNKIETIKSNIIVSNGYATFDIDHCSDYFLTLSIVKEASNSNNSNGMIIIGMLGVIIVLISYTVIQNKK